MFATPTILAIDLGKFNSVFCWFDPATKATTFRTVPSTPEAIRDALLTAHRHLFLANGISIFYNSKNRD